MPQSSIAEDECLVLDIEASLGTTEVFDLDDNDACETSTKASNDISIDLNNFMQEMEEERDSAMGSMSLHLVGGIGGIGGNGTDGSECDENCSEHECCHRHPQHIGSNLQLEDLPSSRQGFDSWWSSSSNNKGSFMGSFRKKMGSSFRLFHSSSRRKDKDSSSSKHNPSSPSSENDTDHHHDPHESPPKRKKAVRFKKFDTIFPFYKSFSRVTVQTEEEEAYTSNHDHNYKHNRHDDDHHNDHTTMN